MWRERERERGQDEDENQDEDEGQDEDEDEGEGQDEDEDEGLFKLKCEPAVGVISQTTNIPCSIESQYKPVIDTVVLKRLGEKNPCFICQPQKNKIIGDPRFKVLGGSSLQLQNTAISDEGEYEYYIRTSLGEDTILFTISVTAKYNNPVITSVPEKIEKNGRAELHCTASGGYPAGTIHWFDQSKTNWTTSASLDITRGDDGLHTLSSTLRFQSFDTLWAPFRCIVLNNKYQEEGRSSFILERKDVPETTVGLNSTVTNSIAGVVVIGSLVAGLLVALLCRQRRVQHPQPLEPQYDEEKEALFKLKCESAVGVISQTTNIPCSIESQKKPVSINTVVLKRLGEKKPCFKYQPQKNTMTGDPRFKVLGGSSLQLQNTAISDEGEYEYYIRTSLGEDSILFTISVTDHKEDHETEMSVTWTIIIVVVVIGCLIIILLVVLWFTRKYLHSLRKARSMELPWNFSKPADVDEKFEQNSELWMEEGFGKSADTLFKLKCESAVGVISQNTNIPCSIESQKKPVSIHTVVLKRLGEKKPCFVYQPQKNAITGDPRFKVLGGSSLQLQNTAISDEGEYEYYIRTSLGEDSILFTISVTAKYNNPVITSVPEKIKKNGRAELHCTASGGYPAGTIHWFDQSNTNWTKSASLDITRGDDGLHTLSSTLRFQSFETLWAPFRCIVLNNKYQEEGRSSFILERKCDYCLINV
ncbi:hypothetical protein C0J50_4186 [Silurus asotus]|uniref:Ig-like domain-containing protein n=1 Tax=Silurus asotus TaxID=30991 RepID=A0AAD5FFR8_SILAS|nr:hypothetical protein C0J50_4186 [Silurus asotus]